MNGFGNTYGRGLGQDANGAIINDNGEVIIPAAEAGAQFKAGYEGAVTFGVPVVTGLVGLGLGFFLGWFVARR
jgi:hypothetical protein